MGGDSRDSGVEEITQELMDYLKIPKEKATTTVIMCDICHTFV